MFTAVLIVILFFIDVYKLYQTRTYTHYANPYVEKLKNALLSHALLRTQHDRLLAI